jgi:uncharacterized membrane protein
VLGGALKRGVLLGLAAAGLLLSLALEYLHVQAYAAPTAASFCTLDSRLDCTSVALSSYSILLGLPVPLWGALGFAAIGTAAWQRSWWLLPLTAAAAVASIALLAVEVLAVGALCLLCEGVHVVALASFLFTWRGRAALAPRTREDTALVLLPPLGVLLGLLVFVPPYWGAFGWKGPLPFPEGVTADGAPWIGAEHPNLTLEEYTDYHCPHCKAATAWTLRRLAARPKDIRIVRRQYPLSPCRADSKNSCLEVRMADCALEQHRFWQMDRWLFAHADERVHHPERAAREVGLDATPFAACLERRETYERAESTSRSVAKRRFVGTPTYMVGNKRISSETADRFLAQGRAD